jgi:prepilin-type N-terminal cleavage/methylation domain-containing protein
MQKKLWNENGLTLIESLLSLFIFCIIGSIVYIVMVSGINTEKKIYTETLLRDEADIVMSQIIDVLYSAPASKVKDASTIQESLLVYQKASGDTTVGFNGAEPVINGQPISTNRFDFSGSSILKSGNSVKINLTIKSTKNENAQPLSLESQFGLMEE